MKKIILLFCLLASFAAIGQQTNASLTTQSNVIRDETTAGANTKTRIAAMFQSLIDSKLNLLNNLSDLDNPGTARTNLGLGTLATQNGTFTSKQDLLVSGTNIKTINGTTLLGSGDLTITSGTVTSFSAGNLSPLFSSNVATATTTPALTFTLSNAGANTVFGNFTGLSAAPSFNASSGDGQFLVQRSGALTFGNLVAGDIPDLSSTYGLLSNPLSQFASTSSAQFSGIISDEIGSGLLPLSEYTTTTQTGTTYTLQLSDRGTIVQFTNASPITLEIPLNAAVAFPTNSQIIIRGISCGVITFSVSGITYTTTSGVLTSQSGSSFTVVLTKRATDTWHIDNGQPTLVNGNGTVFNTNKIDLGALTSDINLSGGFRVGINASPTASITLPAGTTTAGSGPLKIAEGVNPTTPEDGLLNYVSNNITFTETSTVYTLAKTLRATATLDFASTAAGASTDLTITVTGAATGDAVYISAANASVPDNGGFFAWVSATNTVTVRYFNNDLTNAKDPASGSFTAVVVHF